MLNLKSAFLLRLISMLQKKTSIMVTQGKNRDLFSCKFFICKHPTYMQMAHNSTYNDAKKTSDSCLKFLALELPQKKKRCSKRMT